MNKKLLVLLAAGALVLTGCTGNESTKSSEQKNKSEQNDSKKDDNGFKSKENVEIKHDLAAAEKLAHLVAISGNDLKRLNEQTNLLAWITQDKSTKFKSPAGIPLVKVSIQDFVDVVNEFSDKTYSKEEALELLQSPAFNEINGKSTAASTFPKDSEIHYYKEDNVLVFVSVERGHNYPQELDKKENWKTEGDSISINVLDSMTKTKISTIILKLNNKNYTGGHSKSKYYVAEVKSV
ncbi:hypothetical protein [uncultured Gemella sp.]|uniref:hypothetical protein n=1 Tax=uncultured Gemella sp. TaxID=254352 RepID=UPI0028D39BE8|nr:hypothetical protein [uncultured Gemella sp.]